MNLILSRYLLLIRQVQPKWQQTPCEDFEYEKNKMQKAENLKIKYKIDRIFHIIMIYLILEIC